MRWKRGRSLSDAVGEALDFERQLIKVAQVTGKSVSQLSDLTREVRSLATGLGVSSQKLLELLQYLLKKMDCLYQLQK